MITTTTEVKEVHEIFDGPSREALFDALRLAFDTEPKVEFTVNTGARLSGPVETSAWIGAKILFKVIGLEHEDGSGNSFNFEGYIMPPPGKVVNVGHMEMVRGYFNTKTRRGAINVPIGIIWEFEVR